jgi:hypothetical protein
VGCLDRSDRRGPGTDGRIGMGGETLGSIVSGDAGTNRMCLWLIFDRCHADRRYSQHAITSRIASDATHVTWWHVGWRGDHIRSPASGSVGCVIYSVNMWPAGGEYIGWKRGWGV